MSKLVRWICRAKVSRRRSIKPMIGILSKRILHLFACLFCLFLWAVSGSFADQGFTPPRIKVAEGFEVRLAASPPIVGYPMMACLDDRGRLYVAESDGRNLTTRLAIERESVSYTHLTLPTKRIV